VKHYSFVDYATQAYSAFVALLILFFHNDTVAHWPWLFAAHVAGIAAVHFMVVTASRTTSSKALDFFRHFYPVLFYTWFFCETGHLNRMFFTEYLDPMVIRWEQALFGFQPSVSFMDKLPWLPVSELFYASYFCYYLMISGVGIALFLRDRHQFFHFVTVVSFIFYICYTIYIFLPIIGPRVFFREIAGYALSPEIQQLASTDIYPDAVKSGVFYKLMGWIYRVFESPGAALPSSHVAIALATVYFSFRYLRPIRWLHLAVAVLLCLSTIYCRYHYAVDVLAGLITVALLLPFANWLYFKLGVEPIRQCGIHGKDGESPGETGN